MATGDTMPKCFAKEPGRAKWCSVPCPYLTLCKLEYQTPVEVNPAYEVPEEDWMEQVK